jgi:7-cyano-7-deazaguanine reductase
LTRCSADVRAWTARPGRRVDGSVAVLPRRKPAGAFPSRKDPPMTASSLSAAFADFQSRGGVPAPAAGRDEDETRAGGVTHLGSQGTRYPADYDPSVLETFVNKHPNNDYFVKFNCPEFTSLCPITSQPDFATIYISYVPGELMVESKSLKLYLFSFRNHGDFHEDCMNIIMKDLIALMDPKYIEVWGKFTPRGGISIDPYCNYGRPGTRWEEVAWMRLSQHDLYPEKVDNR